MESRLIQAVYDIQDTWSEQQVKAHLSAAAKEDKDVDKTDGEGRTALFLASRFKDIRPFNEKYKMYLAAVEYLLELGCNPFIEDKLRRTPIGSPSTLEIFLVFADNMLKRLNKLNQTQETITAFGTLFCKAIYNDQWHLIEECFKYPVWLKTLDASNHKGIRNFYNHLTISAEYLLDIGRFKLENFAKIIVILKEHTKLAPFLLADLEEALKFDIKLAALMFANFDFAEPVNKKCLHSSKFNFPKLIQYFVVENNWQAVDRMLQHGVVLTQDILNSMVRLGKINQVKKLLPLYEMQGKEKIIFSAIKELEKKSNSPEQVDIAGKTRIRNYLLAFKAIKENNKAAAETACSNMWPEDKLDFAKLTYGSKLAAAVLELYIDPISGLPFPSFAPLAGDLVAQQPLEEKMHPEVTATKGEDQSKASLSNASVTNFGIFPQLEQEQPGAAKVSKSVVTLGN